MFMIYVGLQYTVSRKNVTSPLVAQQKLRD